MFRRRPTTRVIYEIKVTGATQTEEVMLEAAEGLTGPAMGAAMMDAAGVVLTSAKSFAPVWQSSLKEDLGLGPVEQVGGVTQVPVGSHLIYGPAQERGTHAYFPNLTNIRPWAVAHGMTAWQVAMAIVAHGVPKREYLKQAMDTTKDAVFNKIGAYVATLFERRR